MLIRYLQYHLQLHLQYYFKLHLQCHLQHDLQQARQYRLQYIYLQRSSTTRELQTQALEKNASIPSTSGNELKHQRRRFGFLKVTHTRSDQDPRRERVKRV